jgi:DnaK suppressor protein
LILESNAIKSADLLVVLKEAPLPKKPAPKKPAPKSAAKKPTAKKTTPVKKPVAKKPVAKQAPKAAPKKPVAKTALKIVPKSTAPKKPLASLQSPAVKPSTATKASRITPIRAPQITVAPQPKTTATKNSMQAPIVPPNYEPTDKEEFMNPVMKEYFRQRLHDWRDELLRESEGTLHILQEEGNMQKPDITDRASEETDLAIEFRTRDRERKLLNKINEAIGRIDDGTFGYCEETGDPIPVKRLIARPTATMTLEAQELHERRERTQRDQYE